jgi:putative aldouronate transport system permease protein
MMKKGSFGNGVIMAVMVVICIVTLYPVWNMVALSFNDSQDTMMGGVYLWPRQFTLESYRVVFLDKAIL